MPVLSGKAYWAKIYQGRHDPGKPEAKIGPSYNLSLVLDSESLKVAKKEGYEVKDPNDNVPGKYIVARSKITDKIDQPPRVVDAQKREFAKDIGNGSTVNISVHTHQWKVGSKSGVTPILRAVQVIDLIEVSGSLDDFEVVGDTAGSFDPDSLDDDFK